VGAKKFQAFPEVSIRWVKVVLRSYIDYLQNAKILSGIGWEVRIRVVLGGKVQKKFPINLQKIKSRSFSS
jgi:hypothetical protein